MTALTPEEEAALTKRRLADTLAEYQKLKSDNDAFRERTRRNAERRFEERREQLLLRFMDILDNLDRALEAAQITYAGNPLIDGLLLVRTQILQTLKEEGLEWIPVVGRPYDPGVAEAIATEPVDDPEHHHIVVRDELRGYKLNGRLVRAARVVVAEHPDGAALTGGDAPIVLEAVRHRTGSHPAVREAEIDERAELEESDSDERLDEVAAAAVAFVEDEDAAGSPGESETEPHRSACASEPAPENPPSPDGRDELDDRDSNAHLDDVAAAAVAFVEGGEVGDAAGEVPKGPPRTPSTIKVEGANEDIEEVIRAAADAVRDDEADEKN